jgi:pilus assembly protein Flp/PilA
MRRALVKCLALISLTQALRLGCRKSGVRANDREHWVELLLTWKVLKQHRELEDVMKSLAKKVQRFLVSEDGPTAVEYAVMLALIVIVCLTAIRSVGTNANATFEAVAADLAPSWSVGLTLSGKSNIYHS